MSEEKLNLIYEKLLDLEFQIRDIENEKKLKELVSEKQDIQYRIDDIQYIKGKEVENRAELMAIFRTIGEEKEDE
jgi:hypothetical protein